MAGNLTGAPRFDPSAPAQSLAPPGPNFTGAPRFEPTRTLATGEVTQQQAEELTAQSMADTDAADAAEAEHAAAARQAALESKHGAFSSGATSFFRGGLDALLTGGAGVGLTLETAGALTGAKGLEKFGRDMGRAATGKSAMEALAFVFGGGDYAATDYADASSRVLAEQQEARPTLTTISRMAGLAATGLGIGGAAGGHTAAKTALGINMLEGGAAGAQTAYDEAAPLVDVLKSAAVGAAIGGAVTGAVEGIAYGLKRAPDLSKVFGKVQESAEKLALKSVVGPDAQLWNQIAKDPARRARIAETVLPIMNNGDEAIAEAVAAQSAKLGADEITLAKQITEAVDDVGPGAMSEIQDVISKRLAAQTGDNVAIGRAIEKQVAPFRESLAITQLDDFGKPVVVGYRNPTLAELTTLRQELRPSLKMGRQVGDALGEAHRELFATVARNADAAAEAMGPTIAKGWRATAQAADDMALLSGALERKAIGETMGAAAHGGMSAGAIIGAVTASNPIGMLTHAVGGALIHKAVEKYGTKAIATLAGRFAKMGTRVSLRAAGGREMQEVLSSMAQAKRFATELSEAAGSNPVARQEAEELARTIAAQQIAKRAGPIDLDAWHQKPLTPMQKVFYRGALLDKVSEDVAEVAERTAALHPGIPEALDPARLAKLTRDADGPAAIGGLQGKVREIASSVPPTPTGEAAAVALRKAALDVERADVAGAMAKAHELAGWLDQSAAIAQDVPTQDFVKGAAKAIRGQLTGQEFGEAGRLYQAIATGGNTLDGLRNAAKLREALVGLDGHGTLPATIQRAQDEIAAAYEASAKLAGTPRPKTLGKDFEAGERILHAAEEALTLDGKAMHHVFETAQHVGIHEAAHPHAEAGEMTVADAVDGELDHVVPILRGAAGLSPRVYRPGAAAAAAALPLTVEEGRERYREQMKKLTGAATSMATLEDGQHPLISNGANDAIGMLLRDIPKPPSGPLGPAGPDALSADDLRLSNAMFEATVDPGSVFRDLASGYIDPDKASYAWKQYPGYQRACQAGIVDMISNDLTQEEREQLPENLLTQLDATFGFGGRLQETSDPMFAARMSEIFHAEQQKRPAPPQGGMLKLPGADPTFTQRISGAA